MKLRVWIPVLVALTGTCVLFFFHAYDEVKKNAIDGANRQQRLHARQAALGVEEFFSQWTGVLSSLASMSDVVNLDDRGEVLLQSFYEAHKDQINAITMTDERGVIRYTVPDKSSIGRDISHQKHVREILRRHAEVVSDVFHTIQGYDAVALHVPVFADGLYSGSLAITIDFQAFAKRHFEVIRVGETGYAWVLSRDGTVLYSPEPGRTGRSVFETLKGSSSMERLTREMLAGHEGEAIYAYDRTADRNARVETEYAVFMPIRLGDNFWSVAVSSTEDEILSPLAAFRDQLILITAMIFLCGGLLSFLGLKALFIVHEERRRRREDETRSRLQEELQRATKMESIGRLAGGVAHDFNNILTAIVGNASIAMADLGSGHKCTPLLREVVKAAENASSLTRQLLSFARKQPVVPVPIDLNSVVANLRGMLARIIGEDVALRTELAEDIDAVKVDPGQLEQILLNLVVNARDAMPQGGELTISTANVELDAETNAHPGISLPGKYVALAMRDNGCGMSDEAKRHLFEPFFTTKPKGKGTGLGLAMVYGSVAQAGGSIAIESEIGKGTTVRIFLPRCDEAPRSSLHAPVEQSIPGGSETILLAEDEEGVRDLEVMTLERLGYHVLAAKDGREALEIATAYEGRIDLLLTDVVMPNMNGRELADRLTEKRLKMRVLFMSGYSNKIDLREKENGNREAFIPKPHSPRDLAVKIRNILDRP